MVMTGIWPSNTLSMPKTSVSPPVKANAAVTCFVVALSISTRYWLSVPDVGRLTEHSMFAAVPPEPIVADTYFSPKDIITEPISVQTVSGPPPTRFINVAFRTGSCSMMFFSAPELFAAKAETFTLLNSQRQR